MAQTSALHNKWARYSPEGALRKECQQLNALYSQAVDGARIRIPDHLRNPPVPEDESQFVLTALFTAAKEFSQQFLQSEGGAESSDIPREAAQELISRLLAVQEPTISEYQLINLARKLARQHDIDFTPYLSHINFGALMTHEKYALAATMDLPPMVEYSMWNSLLRSDILTAKDLASKGLGGPLRVQRLYSSKTLGLTGFFEYFHRAMDEYTRKLLILKVSALSHTRGVP